MKKLISKLLCASLLTAALPVVSVPAAENVITIERVNVDMQSKTVNIDGEVTEGLGIRTVTLRIAEKNTDFNAQPGNEIQNIAEVQTDLLGNFKYSFELNTVRISADNELFNVYATNVNTGDTCVSEFSVINGYDSVMRESVILNLNNKNAIVFGERQILKKAPYATGGKVYADAGLLNSAFSTELTGDTDLSTLEGLNVYTDNNIVLISEKEIKANIGLFAADFGIYVSQDGSDLNDGRFGNPVKTLAKALELTEGSRGFDGCRIYIKGGDYNFSESVLINEKRNVIIDAYANERVSVNAGIRLSPNDFHSVEDEQILSRVGSAARENLMYLDLSDYMSEVKDAKTLGIENYYKLYVGGRKQQLARYPDVDYDQFVNVDASEIEFRNNERSKNWNGDNAYLVWFNNVYTIWKRMIDCTDGTITINKTDMYGNYGAVANILDELTMKGEWYIDAPSKLLYYSPDSALADIELTVGKYNIFNITNSENITVRNIEIGKTNATAVVVSDCDNVVFDGVEVVAAGGLGISVKNCVNCGVRNSEIHDVEKQGIFLSGGDIPSLTPGGNYAENCHIYDYAPESTNTAGVYLKGMGNVARNNVIHNSASQGVFLDPKSNGMLIENNEIYNVVRGLSDAGAIYGINVKEYTGTKVIGNYVHDLTKSYKNVGGIHGIYLDNGTSGFTVSNNVVTDVPSAGLIGGGRDNTITNNLLIDCTFEKFDARVKLGEWLRHYKNWVPDVINSDGYDEEKWKNTYPFWEGLLADSAKEKAYLDTAVTGSDGTVTYDESKYFDAGAPRNTVIQNNLTIANKKVFSMNPVEIWWKDEGYNLNYTNNLSAMANLYQTAEHSDTIVHSGNGSMKYEITRSSNTGIKKTIGTQAKPGEIYRISAWIYADKVNKSAKAKIATDKNPESIASVSDFPYNIEGSGESNLPERRWTQVYCYWVATDNDNSVVISFPECSVGDVFYIDDVEVERVLYSNQALPMPSLNDIYAETEYNYAPAQLDLSETKSVLSIGESAPINAYKIHTEQNDINGNGIVDGNELKLRAQKAVVASAVSDNTGVLEVTGEGITAIGAGRAMLTVTDSDGNTAKMYVVCRANDEGVYYFDGGNRYVKDRDPVYDGEAYRPYSRVTTDTGVLTGAKTVLGFKYCDSGVSKKDSFGFNRFGFKFGEDEKTVIIEDRWIKGQAEIFSTGKRWQRAAGWHQMICVLEDAGDGTLKGEWYRDGKLVNSQKNGIEKNAPISIFSSVSKYMLPIYIKDLFAVSQSIDGVTKFTDAASFTLDDFEAQEITWRSVRVDLLDNLYPGNNKAITDEIPTWFANLDNRDLRMNENSSLFTLMPNFNKIDFEAIGNTNYINRHEQKSPTLRLAEKNADKTVTFVWDNVSGASSYRLLISKTEDMSDIVYKNTTDTNTDRVWLPEAGGYYYTVTAINLSKKYRCETVSDVYSIAVEAGISFNRTEIQQGDGKRTVSFIYDCDSPLAGKVILAQKDSAGKLAGTVISDIPEVVDGQITITGECVDGNVLECYLWNGTDGMKPYHAKVNN